MARAEDTFRDGYVGLAHSDQSVAVVLLLDCALALVVPRPPRVPIGAAVEGAAARDCDVLLFERVDERRKVHAFDAFPPGENHGISCWIKNPTQRRAGHDVEIDVALELNRARQPFARRDDHTPAS